MVSGRTAINAIVGAVAAIVLSALPFSTLLGGVIAGFLEGPDGREGAIAGALSGSIAFLPFLGIGLFLFAFLSLGVTVGIPLEGALLLVVLFAVITAIAFLYTVVLALFGGYLGAYLAREYPEHHADARDLLGDDPRYGDRYETN